MIVKANEQPMQHQTYSNTTRPMMRVTTNNTKEVMGEKNNTQSETWMQQYTQWVLSQMHAKIYPIIKNITKKGFKKDNPFIIQWETLKDTTRKYPMTQNMSWRNMKLTLSIDDLYQ